MNEEEKKVKTENKFNNIMEKILKNRLYLILVVIVLCALVYFLKDKAKYFLAIEISIIFIVFFVLYLLILFISIEYLILVGAELSLVILVSDKYCNTGYVSDFGKSFLSALIICTIIYSFRKLYYNIKDKYSELLNEKNLLLSWFDKVFTAIMVLLILYGYWSVLNPIFKSFCVFN